MTNFDDIASYDYELPKESIAQSPMNPREQANLMVLPRDRNEIVHAHIADLPHYILPTDVIVVNNSKVFNARLQGILRTDTGNDVRRVELFLIRPVETTKWIALTRPGKAVKEGYTIHIADNFSAVVVAKHPDGTIVVDFHESASHVIKKADATGSVPIPPYIKTLPTHGEYQTVYASNVGSVAAPTAGFHLTKSLLQTLKDKGVTIIELTLHVGLGTFLPVKTTTVHEHTMHSEWVEISGPVAATINEAKKEGRRIIAIGTTTTRALEGVASQNEGILVPYSGDVNLFITPGFHFHIIDGLMTNFHLPKSTLLMLVSAFAGYERIKTAYQEAIRNHYRFYSFGDAMLMM